ncbi:MAG: malate dehydrogenase, partial [Candidatus Sumerlaeia bacterium]|nr:malate dehydrogenase [Candidatus Sumerlaeia bacterium]
EKELAKVTIALIGSGASNICISRILMLAGADPAKIIMVDSKGILNKSRMDLNSPATKEKWEMCLKTNGEQRSGGIKEALEGADVCIALSRPGPGIIKPEWISAMNKDAIVFACANPIPEIWPWEATAAGARIVATGRSDFPNQINNSLGFPAIFRGVLDVWATTVTDAMCIAAAKALADTAESKGINESYICPTMDDVDAYINEAVACGLQAIKEGTARKILSESELRKSATEKITRAQKQVRLLMEKGIIPSPPE